MIALDDNHLLMIEPAGAPTAPLVDDITRKTAGALDAAKVSKRYRGAHLCTGVGCTATSDNAEWIVGGLTTNSLAVHYVACHRAEVPASEIDKVMVLDFGLIDPTEDDLLGRHSLSRRGA
jgi:hypothetical protein